MALALLSGTSQRYQVTWEGPSSHKWECLPKIHVRQTPCGLAFSFQRK